MQTLVYLLVFLAGVGVGWMLTRAKPGSAPRTVYLMDCERCRHEDEFDRFRTTLIRKRVRSQEEKYEVEQDNEEIKI